MTIDELNTEGFSEDDIENCIKLLSIGAEQQKGVNRAFWLNGHCFYIHPEDGITEL